MHRESIHASLVNIHALRVNIYASRKDVHALQAITRCQKRDRASQMKYLPFNVN